MRLTTLLFGSLAGFAIAAKLPDCAGSCISQAVKTTGCSSRDSQCICSHVSFERSVQQCTVSNCGEGKASGAAAFVADFCKSVNDLKRRHGGWHAEAKHVEHRTNNAYKKNIENNNRQQTGNWGPKHHEENKGKKVTPPKYGKPSAPIYAYVASMTVGTVFDSMPSQTIYAPGRYPAAAPSSNPWLSGNGQGGWPKANTPAYAPAAPSPTIYAPGQSPAAVPSSNPWNVGSGQGGWPKVYAQGASAAAPSYRPSFAPSYRPMYAASVASAAPSVAPSSIPQHSGYNSYSQRKGKEYGGHGLRH